MLCLDIKLKYLKETHGRDLKHGGKYLGRLMTKSIRFFVRYAPDINKRANVRRMFPGLGLGFAAFLVLVGWEEFYYKPRHPEKYSTHHH